MKYVLTTIQIVLLFSTSQAQNIGIGTNSPNPNAALEIRQSSNKGLLIPRGDAATRNSLNNNTAKGLMLYDTTTSSIWIHDGSGLSSGWMNQQTTTSPSIIPYASGSSISMTTLIGGTSQGMALVGFGNSVSGITTSGGIIDLTSGGNINYAFSSPRNGTITAISGYFSTTSSSNLIGTTLFMNVQLYISSSPGNIFSPLPGAQVTLSPPFTGPVPIGTICNGINAGLSIPVSAQSRLLLVFYSTAPGSPFITTLNGFASAGVTIQ